MAIQQLAMLFAVTSAIQKAALASFTSNNLTHNPFPAQAACQELQALYPAVTHYPNSTGYVQDNEDFWSQASALGPACIFTPARAEDLGHAVQILKSFSSPFAMRGGGHMPIGDFNNIDSTGVLLSSRGFKQLELEGDGHSLHVGPSNHWQDVYKYLEPEGKVVVGGRLGVVGIPGFVIGGGISFFSAQYGWASNNVKSYTVVLADGSVAKVTPENCYADLFWALRGGGNSFGLITDLELKAYDVPVVSVGIANHGNITDPSVYYGNVVDFALYGQTADEKASVIPVINTGNSARQSGIISYTTYRFWSGNISAELGNSTPASLSYFQRPEMRILKDSFAPKTMHGWSEETAPTFSKTKGLRQRFFTPLTLRVKDKARTVAALEVVHRVYFDAIAFALSELDVWFTGVSPFPMSARSLATSARKINTVEGMTIPRGDPMGLKPENFIVVEFSVSYSNNGSYEPIVTDFFTNAARQIRVELSQKGLDGLIAPWLYLNDADKSQNVFGGYPEDKVRALQQIRHKYDPDRVFTDLMPGGWKVAHA